MRYIALIFCLGVCFSACQKKTNGQSNCYSCLTYDSVVSNIPKLAGRADTSSESHCSFDLDEMNFYIQQHSSADTLFNHGDTIEVAYHKYLCTEQ